MHAVTSRPVAGRTTASHRRREGFTLVELVMVAVLAVLVLGGMMNVLVRQQRFYRGTADLLEARSQTRQAAGILPSELRSISPIGGDIVAMSDSSLEFRATIGSSVICTISGGEIVLPPTNPVRGNVVSTWGAEPAVGDTVLVFNEGPTTSVTDDSWIPYEIASTTTVTGGCPTSTGLTGAADAGKNNVKFAVVGGLGPTIVAGVPLRFVRRARYSLYAAGNGQWYLGYCSPSCGVAGPSPIAGPFVPHSDAAPGLSFTYLNDNGVVTATPSAVAQVSILVRAQAKNGVSLAGFATKIARDSLRFTVALRNRQ